MHTYVPRETCWPCIPLFSNVVNTSIFPDFGIGLYTIAPYGWVAPAQPRPAAAAPPPASARHDMRFGPAVNSLKILGFTAFKRMPYKSMAYKILETDSKSGSESGLTIDRCHILNDNVLSKRRYIQRIKHNVSKKQQQGLSTNYPQPNQPLLFCNNLPNRQQDIHRFSQWFGRLWITWLQL